MEPQQTHSKSRKWESAKIIALCALVLILAVSGWTAIKETAVLPVAPQDRPINTLRDLNQAFTEIAADVKPSVVTVSTERVISVQPFNPFASPFAGDPFREFFFGPGQGQQQQQPKQQEYHQRGLGSGIIVSADGRILTNNHVIEEADSIYVRTYEGKRYTAKVIGTDPQTDVAVLQIDAADLRPIAIGNSDSLQVGEMVLAIGSPMSEELAYSVTQGIVSAKGRTNVGLTDYEDFIQTDAAINPGNSGGPLVNLSGQLVGINSAIASRSGGFQGIGFAVPANMAVRIMNSLVEDGKVSRGWLGVSIQPVSDDIAKAMKLNIDNGVLVGDVTPDSPADKAGMQNGDIITAVNGAKTDSPAALRSKIASTPPGQKVQLDVLRDGRKMSVPVTLGELPKELAGGKGGSRSVENLLRFSVKDLTADLARQYKIDRSIDGAVVTAIDESGPAYEAGLREGDVVTSVNRGRVANAEDFYKSVEGLADGDTVLLRIFRDGGGYFLAFTVHAS